MGNAKKPANGHYSLAKYQAKVEKDGGTPFVLDISEDEAITIERPSTDRMFDVEDAMRAGDSRKIIEAFAPDAAERILEVFGPLDKDVMSAFSEDLQKHFGLGG